MVEELTSYLLRHTLGRPRELIMLGNEILRARRTAKREDAFKQHVVREAVARAAHAIALAYIGEIKNRWAWHKEGELPEDAIKRFIRDFIPKSVVPMGDLDLLEAKFMESCGVVASTDGKTPVTVLASAGLLGWPETDRSHVGGRKQHFAPPGIDRDVSIPATVDCVLVHPILYGADFDVESVKGIVVGPGLPFRRDQ